MPVAPRIKPTCPNCWFRFEPYETLWIASHPSLRGDVRLGADAYRRFLPSRFSARGAALDERGEECSQLACPRCHLPLPWISLELEPWFVSVFGAQDSGKSYYLAAMTRNLRRKLLELFRVNFTDTDALTNQIIAGYESTLFSNLEPNEPVPLNRLIQRTQNQADLYNRVTVGTEQIQYPQPFLFTLRPAVGHPLVTDPDAVSRMLCLYDNAGESFQAGRDSAAAPVTRHLAESSLLLFLFDPTQHPPFQQQLIDRKLAARTDFNLGVPVQNQHLVLTEAANRVRRFAQLRDSERHDRPLVVVVTKKDLWGALVPEMTPAEKLFARTSGGTDVLRVDRLREQSDAIRRLLVRLTPEVVMAAEAFAADITYVAVSSLGTAPAPHPVTREWSIRPGDIRPDGVEVPILYGLNRDFPKLIPGGRRATSASGGK